MACYLLYLAMPFKIYIGGIPNDLDELSLAQLIGAYGDIEVMKIVRDKRTGVGKGYAFVEMVNENAAAEVAAALHGTDYRGRQLDIKPADLPEPPPAAPARYERLKKPGEPERKLRPRRPRM